METMNKTVLVTGASRRIGRALVAALLGRGAARVYAARDVSDPMSREVSDAWHPARSRSSSDSSRRLPNAQAT